LTIYSNEIKTFKIKDLKNTKMNILIKLGIFLAVLLSSILGFAQSRSNKVYDMFSGKDGVSSVSLSKSAIAPYDIFFDDDTKKVIYKMDRFRFLTYNENKGRLRADDVFERIVNELNSVEYFTIDPSELNCKNCKGNWNDENTRLFGRGNRSSMDEFHILVIDNNTCLLFSFYGNISIEDINKCADFSNNAKLNIQVN
jgi:hypothetical protein